jgi:hypothetical protein
MEKILKGVIVVAALGILVWVVMKYMKPTTDVAPVDTTPASTDCVTETKEYVVSDKYMEPVLKRGQKAKVEVDFYKCNKPRKGDLVLLEISKGVPPVIRWIEGIAGDNYSVVAVEGNKFAWNVLINGKKVSRGGVPYQLIFNTVPALSTYEITRKAPLSANELILFAEKSNSLGDSTDLGFIDPKKLIGRVKKP